MSPERCKRLLFIVKSVNDASSRYRCSQYFDDWRQAGWEPQLMSAEGGPLAKLRLLSAARRADAVIVCRKMFPPFLVELLRRAARALVFDFDDALFNYSDGKPSATRRKRFAAMVGACDQVFAGNGYLAAEAVRHNPYIEVSVIPTAVETAQYAPQSHEDAPAHLDMVWIGSRSTRRYLEFALPFLEQAAEVIPRLRLKIVSDFSLESTKLPILAVPWSLANEAEALASAHIGVAPMWDDAWTRGKCALKVLQYMAAGLPVVSSNVGANAEAVEQDASGFLVENTPAAWTDALLRLADDPSLRRSMGQRGREVAEARYDKRIVFRQMAAALQALVAVRQS